MRIKDLFKPSNPGGRAGKKGATHNDNQKKRFSPRFTRYF